MTWMSKETNQKIKKADKPSKYCVEFIKKLNGNESKFKEILKTHLINDKAYDCLKQDDFDGFLVERNNEIIKVIAEKIGLKEKEFSTIIPEMPYDNKMAIIQAFEKCSDEIIWIDKWFSISGLNIIRMHLPIEKIKNVKILTSGLNINDSFVDLGKDLIKQFGKQGVILEIRIIPNKDIGAKIHDRYLISKTIKLTLPSIDVVERGQYSEVKASSVDIPYQKWWDISLDLFRDYNKIKELFIKN